MSPARSRAAAHARRAEIEAAALDIVRRELAAGRSFTAISLQSIARELQVPRTTLYMHFRDKTGLLLRLGDIAVDEVSAVAATWLAFDPRTGPAGATKPGVEMLTTLRAHRDVSLAMIEVASYDPALADYWHARLSEFADTGAEMLGALQERGRIAPDIDVHALSLTLVCLVERTASVHIRHGDPADDERVAAAIGRLIWLAVYGDAPGRAPKS